MPWRLEHEVLIAGALRVAVQRIGITHWRPAGRLRSWGLAPLHREGNAVFVPCADTEALWLGAWLEEGADAARVELGRQTGGARASVTLPPDGQLSALDDAVQGPQPLTLAASISHRARQRGALELRLELRLELNPDSSPSTAALEFVLLTPDNWASRSGRTPTAPRTTPPPRPPRLG